MIGRGIARTFQNLALFPSMTVLENVLVGSHIHRPCGGRRGRALSLLDYSTFGDVADREAVAAVRDPEASRGRPRLTSDPKLLLLDEPAGGLSRKRLTRLGDFVRNLKDDFALTVPSSSITCAS